MIDLTLLVGAVGALAAFVVPAALTQLRVAREIGGLTTELRHVVEALGSHREVELQHDRQLHEHEARLTILEGDVEDLEQHHKG